MDGKQLIAAITRQNELVLTLRRQLAMIAEDSQRRIVDSVKLKKWADRNLFIIETIFKEFDMGLAATVINGLLGQITALNTQLANQATSLQAAQADALDSSDQAAIAAGQQELAAFAASQNSASQNQTTSGMPAPSMDDSAAAAAGTPASS